MSPMELPPTEPNSESGGTSADTDRPTKRALKRSVRLASPQQLWVLNRAGWISLRESPDVMAEILNDQADDAIKRSMHLNGEDE